MQIDVAALWKSGLTKICNLLSCKWLSALQHTAQNALWQSVVSNMWAAVLQSRDQTQTFRSNQMVSKEKAQFALWKPRCPALTYKSDLDLVGNIQDINNQATLD